MLELKNVIQELREEYRRAQSDLKKLDRAIATIEGAAGATRAMSEPAPRKHGDAKHLTELPRIFSVSARRRISQAQKARWAKFRADKKQRAS